MSVFQPVEFEWEGEVFTIPAHGVLATIADIESIVTFMELALAMSNPERVPLARLSQVYSIALRHAGAAVTPEEIYAGLFGDDHTRQTVTAAIGVLVVMMSPPGSLSINTKAPTKGGARAQKKTSPSSKGSTKRLSRKRSSRRKNSGS